MIRKAIKKRKLFPTDDPAKKVICLVIQAASKKMSHADPKLEIRIESIYTPGAGFALIEFEDRLVDYI